MINTALNGDLTGRVIDSMPAMDAWLLPLATSTRSGATGSSRIFGAASSV
jgi:hypothetical protein